MGYYSKEKFISGNEAEQARYIAGFRRWLEMLNYHESSQVNGPRRLQEFFEWMEANGVNEIEQITGKKVKQFFEYLSKRKSKTTGEVLTLSTLRTYLTTINRFTKYLRQTGEGNLEVPIHFKGRKHKETVVLTRAEIDRLYQATNDSLLGIRDRAMLAVYYGCGLRRNEGIQLEIKDVLPDRNLLYVRKGKGYKERYVPMVGKVKTDVLEYIQYARPMLLHREGHSYFFVGLIGKPMQANSMYVRIRKLAEEAGIKKNVGLHTLRHSIATHLHQNGMSLAEIGKFLGHSSMESTQIYTHLKNETD
jgi:site-specific recombinase XerD